MAEPPDPTGSLLRLLVIANRTCPCPLLPDRLLARASGRPTQVLVIAPALNSRLRHIASDTDAATARARARLLGMLPGLADVGLNARGEVGDEDPLRAIEDALRFFAADEIVVSTWPAGRSNWLEKHLPERARDRFKLPVTHLVSSYGLDNSPDA